MDTVCLSALVDTLVNASYLFGFRERKSSKKLSEDKLEVAREAYAFISGTGLEIMIQFYNMDLNADELRGEFSRLWNRNVA